MAGERIAALAAVVVLGGCQSTEGPATVQSSFVVPAGVERLIHQDYDINGDCSSQGDIVVRVTSPPQHGVITVRPGTVHPTFPASNTHSACNSRSVVGKQTWYRPAPGYVGEDSVAIEVVYPTGHDRTYQISISVR